MSDLPKQLRIKAGMIHMGERIAWGSDTTLMEEAADLIEQLQARVLELEKQNAALATHVNRLVKVCELARDNYGKMLMTDPPQEAWKTNQVTAKLVEAIAATPTANLAEHDAEVARKAFIDGALWHVGLSIHDDRPHGEDYFRKIANEYAQRIKENT